MFRSDVAALRVVEPLVPQRERVLLPKLQIEPRRYIDVVMRVRKCAR